MAGALHPRHWDPNIAHSSTATSTAASARSFPLESNTDLTSLAPSAARNSNSVEDGDMSTQQWVNLASTLGISPTDTTRSSPEAQKFARKIGKRQKIPEKQLTELLLPVITSITTNYPRLLSVLFTTFNREPVPLDHPSFIFNKTRLPTPRPAITLGYNPQIFHPHYRELMQGIIADSSGQPRNLDKISSACPGLYWPFFAIEVNDDSFSPSLAAASTAAATATCNNALLALAEVLNDVSNPVQHDPPFRKVLTTSISSFSLAITSQIKSATLFAHTTSFNDDDPYAGTAITDAIEPIRTYNLNNPSDLESLSARLSSIFAWAQQTRLLAIMDLLDRFDARVQFKETKVAQEQDLWGPMDVMQRGQNAPKLMPGMVQLSGGLGKGMSSHVPSPPAGKGHGSKTSVSNPLSAALLLGKHHDKDKEKEKPKGKGKETDRERTSANISHPIPLRNSPKAFAHPAQSRSPPIISHPIPLAGRPNTTIPTIAVDGNGPRSNGSKPRWTPATPRTPESMQLTLQTNGVQGAGVVGPNGKVKKGSLFKTVINDAMPAWTRVEI